MKLEVGLYARTESCGIVKIEGFYSTLSDDYIATHNDLVRKKEITKTSYNIIDLIRAGDFVNGKLVTDVYLDGATKYIKLDNAYENGKGVRTYAEDIKTIVTCEQFESMSYKVGE